MLFILIIEFEMRRPGPPGRICTPTTVYFYDKTKISKENPEALLGMVILGARVRGVTLYVWRTLHDVTPLLVKLVKTEKKGFLQNSVGFRSKSKRRPKKRSLPKILWVFAAYVDWYPINWNKKSLSQTHYKMVSPQNGDTRGGPPPPSDATKKIRDWIIIYC